MARNEDCGPERFPFRSPWASEKQQRLLTEPLYSSWKRPNRGKFLAVQQSWDDIERGVFAIVGSPETVRQKLEHYQKELGAGTILTGCQVGSLSHEQGRMSMELLAREVFPKLRASAGSVR